VTAFLFVVSGLLASPTAQAHAHHHHHHTDSAPAARRGRRQAALISARRVRLHERRQEALASRERARSRPAVTAENEEEGAQESGPVGRYLSPERAAELAARPGIEEDVERGGVPPFYDPTDLKRPPILSAPTAVLVDADTGQLLWSKNPDERHFPASTTKILTALLFVEHTRPTDIVTCTDPNITQIEESSLHIKPSETFTAQDLLYGTLLRSANDGAVVMAEHVAGSVPKFADMMNAKARELGATESHFVTPNGLPDPDHYTTARDLARIACAAMQNPRFADAVGTPERTIQRSIVVRDEHIVAKAKPMFYDRFPGADGVKTGYTRAAGHCFVGSATRDGRRLLSVVLGARSSATHDTIPLLSWGFARYTAVFVARRGQIAGEVPVAAGAMSQVPAMAAADLHASLDRLAGAAPNVAPEVLPDPGLTAPIRRGQEVGKLVEKIDGKAVCTVPLLAATDVPRSMVAAALTGGGRFGHGMSETWAAIACGAGLLLLVGFRYATTAGGARSGTAAGARAATKGARRRRDRVAASRRGDYRGR
jgi:D-alanyl-D-alanine carboxypeptidase (penicillin-binding protein 5/6)